MKILTMGGSPTRHPPVVHFQLQTSLYKTEIRFRAISISLKYGYPK